MVHPYSVTELNYDLCLRIGGGGGVSPAGRGGGFGRGRGRPGRDTALIGKTIRISQGPYKGKYHFILLKNWNSIYSKTRT